MAVIFKNLTNPRTQETSNSKLW